MVDSRMWGGVQLSSACASAPAALITLSSGVTMGVCQIFVFEESCARDAGCARGYQPELPTLIVFG
jgi:hypothetical protein